MAEIPDAVAKAYGALVKAQQSGNAALIAVAQRSYDAQVAKANDVAKSRETGYHPSMGPLSPITDRIHAMSTGVLDGVLGLGPTLTNFTDQSSATLNNVMGGTATAEDAARRREAEWKQFPVESTIAKMGGAALSLAPFGATKLGQMLLGMSGPAPLRVATGALSGAGISAGDAAIRGQDPLTAALWGGGAGAALPILGNVLKNFKTKEELRNVLKALESDGVNVDQLATEMQNRGVDAVLADMGDNARGLTAALVNTPGPARNMLLDYFRGRKDEMFKMTRDALDTNLGKPVDPQRIDTYFNTKYRDLSTAYDALDYSRPVNVAGIEQDLRTYLPKAAAGSADDKVVRSLLKMLRQNEAAKNNLGVVPLITEARTLQSARMEARKLLEDPQGKLTVDAKRTLKDAIDQMTKELHAKIPPDPTGNSPGIAQLDEAWAKVKAQEDALATGKKVFDTGNPIWPQQVDTMMADPNAAPWLKVGSRNKVAEMFGSTGRDITKLRQLVQSDGDWNYMKLASIYGKDVADEVYKGLGNLENMTLTNNTVTGGSPTARNQQFAPLVQPAQAPKALTEQINNLLGTLTSWGYNTAAKGRSDYVNKRMAQLLTMKYAPDLMDALAATKATIDKPSALFAAPGAVGVTAPQRSK